MVARQPTPARVGFVVEGPSDYEFFRSQRTWLEARSILPKIRQARDRPQLVRRAVDHYKALRMQGCERVVFVLDQDDDGCAPAAARLLGPVRQMDGVIVAVAAKELEAWLLADVTALRRVCEQNRPDGHTDGLDNPKGVLREMFRKVRHKHLSEVEMVRCFTPHFSFDRAAGYNQSAARFVARLSRLSTDQ